MKNRDVIGHRILGIMGTIVLTVTLLSLSMMGCSKEENQLSKEENQLFQNAEDLLLQKDYKGAIEKWEQFIKEHPNNPSVREALLEIGNTHLLFLANYKEALSSYHKILEGFPDDKSAQHRIGVIQDLVFNEAIALFNEKQYKKAYEAFYRFADDEQLKGYRQADAAMYNTAICLHKQGEYDDALKHYETFTKNFPTSELMPKALFQIGFLNHTITKDKDYDKNKDYKQSLLDFRKILKQFPRNDRVDKATVGIVLNLSKLKRFDEIPDQVDNFTEQFPTNKWLAILESYKKGTKLFDYAMPELMPWERKLEWENARNAFKEILSNKELLQGTSFNLKEDVESHITRSYLDEGKDDYKREAYKAARKTLDKLLKQFPDSDSTGEARSLIAQSYLDEKKYNQAFINFDTLTSTEFDGSPQLQAEAMYKAAYSLKSLSIDSNYEILSKALSDEALVRYTEFLTRFPDSKYVSDAYFDQGKIYAAQKNYEFALHRYEDALRNTDDPERRAEIQLHIGGAYQGLGSDNKAIETFEKAVNAADEAIKEKEDIENAKLSWVRAMYFIVGIHIQRKEWDVVRDIYNRFIEKYGEAEYEKTTSEFGEPIKTDFMIFCAYQIGKAYDEMKDFRKALEWYEKIVKEKGFQADDSISDSLKEKDFRTDALAPQALYRALLVRNQLEGAEKLEGIANTYINDMRGGNSLLSAKARFNFAKMKREVFQDYEGAAKEFAKLATYRGSDPSLNLVKLQGKYYEGLCHEQSASSEDAEAAYKKVIMLFNLNFQRLIDAPHIKPPNISEKVFDYWIQTALEYAEKACAEIRDTEYTNKACAEIKQARQKLESKDKTTQKSDASNNSNSSEASQTKRHLTPEQIAQKASGSTVFITMEGTVEYEMGEIVEAHLGTGSGFFVKPNQIATNYHVITPKHRTHNKDDDKNEIVFTQPLRGTARIVGTDREYAIIGYTAINPDRDLAILKVRALDVEPLVLGDSDPDSIKQGTPAYPIGNPRGLVNVVSDGKISSVQWVKSTRDFFNDKSKPKDVQRADTPQQLLMMTAPISPGSSGGPVLDGKGRVIGVSVGYRVDGQNLNYAVPVNYLKALLNLVGPPKPLSDLEIIY